MPISLYQQSQTARVSTGQPSLQSAGLDVSGAYKRTDPMEGIREAASGALSLGKQWLESARAADVSELSLQFHQDLNTFKIEYAKTHKGKDALNAGADFETFANAKMSELQENSDVDRTTKLILARSTGPAAVSFMSAGQGYGVSQEQAWKESTAKGAIATLGQFVAENYSNPDLVETQKQLTKAQIAATFPGMDMTAQFAELDQQTTGNRIGAYMAAGDLSSAKALFTKDRALLGPRADEYAMKIANREEHNMRMALANEEKSYRMQQRAEAAMSNDVQKQIADALITNDFNAAGDILSKHRDVISADDYRSLLTSVHRPPAASSDSLVAMQNLMKIKTSSDPSVRETLPTVANQLYLSGGITSGTRDSMTKNLYDNGDKVAMEQLDTFFGAMTFDQTRSVSLTNAKNDYFNWKDDNTEASASERVKKSRELINTYSLVALDKSVVWAEMSSYLNKTDLMERRSAAVAEAERKLVEDKRSGKIDPTFYNRQAAKLRNLRIVLNKEDEAMAATASQNKGGKR